MKILRYLKYMWMKRNPLSYAKKIGVTLGAGTKLIDNPNWGSEPYLIEIGENCLLSGGVTFINHDRSIRVFQNLGKGKDLHKFGRIKIGNNCFIGAKAMILPGVTIGDNVIVAAGAVVTKSIPDNEIWGGNPAHFITTIDDYYIKCEKNCLHATHEEMHEHLKETLLTRL